MRSLLLPIPLLLACDSTLTPDPPAVATTSARGFSLAYTHTMVATEPAVGTGANLVIVGSDVPRAMDNQGSPATLDLPVLADVAVGRRHACGLSTTGSVHCWGDHRGGALGSNRVCAPPTVEGAAPNCILGAGVVAALPPVRALAAGDDVTCAITTEDRVVCWGVASRVGGSTLPALDPPTPVRLPDATPLTAARVIIGAGAVCAIDRAAALWCWGDGFGALPVRQPQVGVVDVAIGARHRCVIDAAGLACWGDNRNGQVGDVAAARACDPRGACEIAAPHHVELDARRVVVGERHTCALDGAGVVSCWGSNEVGQLGRADAFLVGDIAPALADATGLGAGYAHACAQRADGAVWCWGATDVTDPAEAL